MRDRAARAADRRRHRALDVVGKDRSPDREGRDVPEADAGPGGDVQVDPRHCEGNAGLEHSVRFSARQAKGF